MTTFVSVGGDKRIAFMRRYLREHGWTDHTALFKENGTCDGDVLILPVPAFTAEGKVSGTADTDDGKLLSLDLPEIVIGGMLPRTFRNTCAGKGVKVYNVTDRDDYAIFNAVPTAEAAIMIALEELPVTLWGNEVLVTGYGRVARVLCERLQGLGALVTVAARNPRDLAYAVASGLRGVDITDLNEVCPARYRVIFNTVPSLVIDRAFAEQMNPESLTIDLASIPGGCDADAMESLGRKRIHALSLPGRNAPESAGFILGRIVEQIVKEANNG